MKQNLLDFFTYFFGKGENTEFKYFGISHIIPILIMIGIIYLIFKYKDKISSYKYEDRIRVTMAVIMIIAEMSYFWRLLHSSIDANVYEHLPITICGIAK